MTDKQISNLLSERDRLLNAWQMSDGADKVSILTRIEDIDDQLADVIENPMRKVHQRRFIRR